MPDLSLSTRPDQAAQAQEAAPQQALDEARCRVTPVVVHPRSRDARA